MPVETFTTIDSLNASNPPASDGLVGGDDHLRGIKATIKATFPSIAGIADITHTILTTLGLGKATFLADGTLGAPSVAYASEPGLGFYRSAAAIISFTGKMTGNGACPTGLIGDFLQSSIPAGWYELNGQAVSRTGDTAALFALYGTTYGVGNGTTTFNLPNIDDYYRRSRGGSLGAFYTKVADGIESHTASVSGTAVDHSHTANVNDPGHDHAPAGGGSFAILGAAGGTWATPGAGSQNATATTAPAVTGITVAIVASGALAVSGTATYTGETETRPKTVVVVTCVKS